MKLLIAEDEPALAEALQSFFEKNYSPSIPSPTAPTLTPTPSPVAMTH